MQKIEFIEYGGQNPPVAVEDERDIALLEPRTLKLRTMLVKGVCGNCSVVAACQPVIGINKTGLNNRVQTQGILAAHRDVCDLMHNGITV